jgi:hypothetical protein
MYYKYRYILDEWVGSRMNGDRNLETEEDFYEYLSIIGNKEVLK